ncbi:MAG: hypothetical protein GY953_10460 [bacterium]|nr:hypothetical protein [bacterium]
MTLAPLQGRFHKFVTMNSYDKAPKGHTYAGTLIRVRTSTGVEGVGTMGYARPDAEYLSSVRKLVGADPLGLYEWRDGRITGRASQYAEVLRRYRHLDGPLFDLIGKLTSKPCWQLLGEAVRDRVEVYDGTLYFSDVWFRDRGVRAVVEEAEEAVRSGYLGLKFKVGRGSKWMEKEPGLLRDIEVLRAVRDAVGPGTKILADANNGYRDDHARAWRLLEETREANLFWMEELVPEDPAIYTKLRRGMKGAGIETLIADGESVRDLEEFRPYLKPTRLVDVLQMDIRRGGLLDCRKMGEMAAAAGGSAVPHNWGSQIGLLMGLHLAKSAKGVIAAEDDRSTCDVIDLDGYSFQNGFYTVSDSPGLGITVNEAVYAQKCRPRETVLK